jgi:hypothetical protein
VNIQELLLVISATRRGSLSRSPVRSSCSRPRAEPSKAAALEGTWADLDSLAGWVAGEVNHTRRRRRPRQTELLDSIADQLEDVLAAHRR